MVYEIQPEASEIICRFAPRDATPHPAPIIQTERPDDLVGCCGISELQFLSAAYRGTNRGHMLKSARRVCKGIKRKAKGLRRALAFFGQNGFDFFLIN